MADDPRTLFRAASQAEKVMTFLDIPAFEREPLPQVKKEQDMEQGRKTEAGRRTPSRRKERQVA
ncbi:TPA: hypothetical protein ACOD9U_000733 [Stenotrophomonas maltophilia]